MDHLDISSKAALIRLEKQLVDISMCYQTLSVYFHDLDAVRNDVLGRLASPALLEQLASLRTSAKIILPSPSSAGSMPWSESSARFSGSFGSPAAGPPKMFSKLPKEVIDANLPKPELMRLSAVYELIETEADYCRDLSTIINASTPTSFASDQFCTDISPNAGQSIQFHKIQMRESKIVSEADIAALFSNVDQLLVANQSLKVYTSYAANYPAAMKLVHHIQARTDIKDLLQELEKYTERAGNAADQANLRTAAERIESVVSLVNEATRQAEERQRILNLEATIESPVPLGFGEKKHLKDGPLQRLAGGKAKERYVVLFTDLLIICKAQKGPSTFKYELETVYSLAELTPRHETRGTASDRDIECSMAAANTHITRTSRKSVEGKTKTSIIMQFNIITSEDKDTLAFATATEDERNKWVDMFNLTFKDITEEHRSAVKNKASAGIAKQSSSSDVLGIGFRTTVKRTKNNTGRGTSMGPASSLLRKQAAARVSLMENWMVGQNNAATLNEPECVEIGGVIHKRAIAATGNIYYFAVTTRQSIWKLPENYTIVDTVPASAGVVHDQETAEGDASREQYEIEEEEGMMLDSVDGFPDWRRVDRGDGMPYFFNINTQETRWEHPSITSLDA
nr:Rho guanine nucleotide exchange factor 4 [Polyrhizophydium stewartii]